MSKSLDSKVVVLVTADRQRDGTQLKTDYSAIFVVENIGLDSVESNVFDMVRTMPECWSCGCVTGYPAALFSDDDRKAFTQYGLNHRFKK